MKEILKLVASALANFAAISFGIAVYQGDPLGFVLGGYTIFAAGVVHGGHDEYLAYGIHCCYCGCRCCNRLELQIELVIANCKQSLLVCKFVK